MASYLPFIGAFAVGAVIMFGYRMMKGRGESKGGIVIGGRRFLVLLHAKVNAVIPISATRIGPAFITREYGGYLEMEGHAATLRYGHVFLRRPANQLESDATQSRTTVYALREVDARPLYLQGGAATGYTGRRARANELKIVEDMAAQRAESEAVVEGSADENTAKMLTRAVVAAVAVTLIVWVGLFAFSAYRGVSVI